MKEMTTGEHYKPTDYVDEKTLLDIRNHIQMAALGSLGVLSLMEVEENPAYNIVLGDLIHAALGIFMSYHQERGREGDPEKLIELVSKQVRETMKQIEEKKASESAEATKQ